MKAPQNAVRYLKNCFFDNWDVLKKMDNNIQRFLYSLLNIIIHFPPQLSKNKKNSIMKNLFVIFACIFALALFSSCEKDTLIENPETENLVAPPLPPASFFTIPTEAFDDNLVNNTVDERSDTKQHWIHAGLNILVWNTVFFVNMALPTQAFGMAFDHEPQYIGNNTFEWAYQYQAPPSLGEGTYLISLQGQYIEDNQSVKWVMTASEVGGFPDFVWYTGVMATDLSSASFTLNRNPENPQPYVRFDIENDVANETFGLLFTNVIPNDPNNGTYIEYKIVNDEIYNREYNVLIAPDNLLEIQFNEEGGNGRVKHPAHFNNEEWHCWDEEQMDLDC